MSNNIEMYSHLKLKVLDEKFKYVLLDKGHDIASLLPFVQLPSPFMLMSAPDELSLICEENIDIENIKKTEGGWRCIQIVGDMPFGSVPGMIATITPVLKKVGIGVCIISSYLKDFFFVYEHTLEDSLRVLKEAGWELFSDDK